MEGNAGISNTPVRTNLAEMLLRLKEGSAIASRAMINSIQAAQAASDANDTNSTPRVDNKEPTIGSCERLLASVGNVVVQNESLENCNCKKSGCLKLYCQCFSARQLCNGSCNCLSCMNNDVQNPSRVEAIRSILERNPNAFESKFKGKAEVVGSVASGTVHKIGCRCRKSMCLKKYCECFQAAVACSGSCTCLHCCNTVAAHSTGQLYEYQKLLKAQPLKGEIVEDTSHIGNAGSAVFSNNDAVQTQSHRNNTYAGKKYLKNPKQILNSITSVNSNNQVNSNYSSKVSSDSYQCSTLLKDEYIERAATDLQTLLSSKRYSPTSHIINNISSTTSPHIDGLSVPNHCEDKNCTDEKNMMKLNMNELDTKPNASSNHNAKFKNLHVPSDEPPLLNISTTLNAMHEHSNPNSPNMSSSASSSPTYSLGSSLLKPRRKKKSSKLKKRQAPGTDMDVCIGDDSDESSLNSSVNSDVSVAMETNSDIKTDTTHSNANIMENGSIENPLILSPIGHSMNYPTNVSVNETHIELNSSSTSSSNNSSRSNSGTKPPLAPGTNACLNMLDVTPMKSNEHQLPDQKTNRNRIVTASPNSLHIATVLSMIGTSNAEHAGNNKGMTNNDTIDMANDGCVDRAHRKRSFDSMSLTTDEGDENDMEATHKLTALECRERFEHSRSNSMDTTHSDQSQMTDTATSLNNGISMSGHDITQKGLDLNVSVCNSCNPSPTVVTELQSTVNPKLYKYPSGQDHSENMFKEGSGNILRVTHSNTSPDGNTTLCIN